MELLQQLAVTQHIDRGVVVQDELLVVGQGGDPVDPLQRRQEPQGRERDAETRGDLHQAIGLLLDLLSRVQNWQRHPGLAELQRDDRRLLAPQFTRLAQDARAVANLVDELWHAHLQEQTS